MPVVSGRDDFDQYDMLVAWPPRPLLGLVAERLPLVLGQLLHPRRGQEAVLVLARDQLDVLQVINYFSPEKINAKLFVFLQLRSKSFKG